MPVTTATSVKPVPGLTLTQVRHAAEIIDAVRARGLPALAAVYAITCSLAEASLMNWENYGTSTLIGKAEGRQINAAERAVARQSIGLGDGPYKPHGTVIDNLDSMGLFAQRPMSGWGTPQQIMTPSYAIGKFLDALTKRAGWDTRPFAEVIAQTQGYYDATVYASNRALADRIMSILTGGV